MKYYQPELTERFCENNPDFYSFFAFKGKKLAEKVFPNSNIITYNTGDIENPTYVDYQYYKSIYNVDIKPLQKAISTVLGVKVFFETEVSRKGSGNNRRLHLESQDLTQHSGIFSLPLQKVTIGSFGGGVMQDDKMWMSINMFYKHKEGGTNGLKIADATWDANERTWEIDFVKTNE